MCFLGWQVGWTDTKDCNELLVEKESRGAMVGREGLEDWMETAYCFELFT